MRVFKTMPVTLTNFAAGGLAIAIRAAGGLRMGKFVVQFVCVAIGVGLVGPSRASAHFRGPISDPAGHLFFADNITYDFAPSPTPEPASLLMFGTGVGALLARRRSRRVIPGTDSSLPPHRSRP